MSTGATISEAALGAGGQKRKEKGEGRNPKNGQRDGKDVIRGSSDAVHTLSVSIVATSSSASTVSPTFFCQVLSVPSEMDSAI